MADRDNNYKAAVFQLYSIANKKSKNGILMSKLISCQGLLEDIDLIVTEKPSLKCHYDQILDIHFFTFSYTIGLF